jgi:hypothetical protein
LAKMFLSVQPVASHARVVGNTGFIGTY